MGCCGSKEEDEEREPLKSGRVYEAPNQRQHVVINSTDPAPVFTPSSLVLATSLGRSWEDPNNQNFQDVVQKTVSSLIDVSQTNSVGGVSSKEAERRSARYKETVFKVALQSHAFDLPKASHEHVDLRENHIDRGLLEIVVRNSEIITKGYKEMKVKDTGPFVVNFTGETGK